MDPKGKGMVINDKEKESFVNDPKDDKSTDSGSGHKRKDGRKKKTRRMRKNFRSKARISAFRKKLTLVLTVP